MNQLRRFALPLLILLIGFALRLALYNYHGLEGDDSFSLALSRDDTGDLLAGLARLELDIHPPLHFLALKAWTAIAGDSLLALRLMNILADVLTGALLMRLTGRTLSRRAALLAGLFWLASPLLIYATYLVRMYTLLALFTTAGAACLAEARYGSRGLWYAGAAACGLLAAGSHVIGGVVLVALALAMLAEWMMSQRRFSMLAAGAAAFALAGLLYLPYAASVWALYRSGRPLGAEISEASFNEPFSALAAILSTLLTHRLAISVSIGLLLVIVLVAGSLLLWRRWHGQILPLLVLAWLMLLSMSGLAWLAGMYKARYLTPLVPLLLALLAGILAALLSRYRRLPLLLALLVVGIGFGGLVNDLDRNFRDDWVAAAAFIEQHERPGDAVIVIPDWGQEAFNYHYHGTAPVTGVFPQVSAAVDLDSTLTPLISGHDRVWLVRYQPEVADAEGRAEGWFRDRAPIITEIFPSGMHIKYYDFHPQMDTLPDDVRPLDAQFGDTLRLRAVYLPVTNGSASDTRLHPPSGWVQVVLYWEALHTGLEVTPRVRFTDSIGQTYGAALERDNDLTHRSPVSQWQPGSIWQVGYDLNLNPDTPPGLYNIEVMVLDSTGQPLPASGADTGESWVIAGQFQIE
ncbi:MAG: glycosyltransferase family 39 protein [Anaerolineae bacterium]|nr:glycosyltransferase family 39 protein [Anaerolineae bacterium]